MRRKAVVALIALVAWVAGEAFVSNAVVGGRYALRACITNFRTTAADVEALPEIVRRHGRAAHAAAEARD